MHYRGRHIKDDPFGRNTPAPFPMIEDEEGEIVPGEAIVQFDPDARQVVLNKNDSVRELSATIRANEGKTSRLFVREWDKQREFITQASIQQNGLSLVATQKIEASYSEFIKTDLRPTWELVAGIGAASVVAGIQDMFGTMPGTQPIVSLPGLAADQWMRGRGLNLAVNLTTEQRIAADTIIQQGLRRGLGEQVIARQIRPVIGLTNREAQSVVKLRNQLTVDRVNPRMVERIVNTRATKLLRTRAKRIARTEMTWSYNMGQLDAVKAYRQAGWIPQNVTIVKKWRKVLPVPECFCDALDGQIIGLESTFPGATPQVPNTLTPPAHPNCACAIDIVVIL